MNQLAVDWFMFLKAGLPKRQKPTSDIPKLTDQA
jgi:hypothetical protein